MTDITFTYTPDVGYQPDIVPAVNRVRFGGGYVQTSARGINLDGATLRMSFTNRTKTEVDGIVWALKQSLGGRILYTLPGESTARLWDVQRWTPPVCGEGGQVWSMEVELAETFEDGHANWNPLHFDFDTALSNDWVWINQGSATASVAGGELVLTSPYVAPLGTVRGLAHPMPKQGSWKITAGFYNNTWSSTANSVSCIGVRNSRSGVIVGLGGANVDNNTGKILPGISQGSPSGKVFTIEIDVDAQTNIITLKRDQLAGSGQIEAHYSTTKTFADLGGRPDQVVIVTSHYSSEYPLSITGNNVVRLPYLYVDAL